MYESYWTLRSRPFDNRADDAFYYPSESHQAAMLKLHYAIESRRSVAVLCGEPGLGKTMLLDSAIRKLPAYVAPTVRIVYPAMPPEQLIRYIARQIAPHENDAIAGGLGQSIETIERMLRHNVGENQHALIAIDEAHLLEGTGALEPLRLLLNLANELADSESSMTIVLSGSSALLAHLARHPAFEDRIAARCVLERFSLQETVAYMSHRLRVAGWHKPLMFDDDAIRLIQQLTLGIPRRINRVCDLSLMIAFAQDRIKIDANIVENANDELSTRSIAA